jgi:hypothetical protein
VSRTRKHKKFYDPADYEWDNPSSNKRNKERDKNRRIMKRLKNNMKTRDIDSVGYED